MKLKLFMLSLTISLCGFSQPISINALSNAYDQNFNTLDTVTSGILPVGWLIFETGNPPFTYGADNGGLNTGNTYSYGVRGIGERALGSLASASVRGTIGSYYVNNTNAFITSVNITFNMEQWRSGGRTTPDSSEFFYGINTSGVSPARGTWIKQSNLNLTSKFFGTAGARNGNDTTNQRNYNITISNIAWMPGDTMYIRWTDIDVLGSDDGLAIDDFTLTAFGTTAVPVQNVTNFALNQTSSTTLSASWNKSSLYNNDSFTMMLFGKIGSTVTIGLNNKFSVNDFTANNNLGAGTAWPNDTAAKCLYKGDLTNVSITNFTPSTAYSFFVVVVRDRDTAYSTGVSATFTTNAANPPPLPLVNLTANVLSSDRIRFNISKPNGYVDSTHTILLFLKRAAAITQGAPNFDVNRYQANNDFNLATSRYQNDTAARCVMNSDSISVIVSGLTPSTTYHVLAFAVRVQDSSYATGVTLISSTISAALPPATNIVVTGLTNSTARISWTKPVGYINNRYSTVVFVKPDTAILPGSATLNPVRITANPSLTGNGSQFFADPAAKCVFKADTNFVVISNMAQFKTYHVVVQVVNDADSVYSNTAYGSGTALGPPPYYPIAPCVNTNTTTGLPDSNNVRATFYGLVYGINQRSFGLLFLLRDRTGGITISSTSKTYGYTVKEGDSIMVSGTISSNRGLAQMNNPDTVMFISAGGILKLPKSSTKLSEETENDLIFIPNLRFVTNPTGGVWPTTNAAVNVVTPNKDTFAIRVVNTSALAGKPVPTTTYFDIIGLGSQTSTNANAPFAFNGYQLLPMVEIDVIPNPDGDSLNAFSLLSPGNNLTQTIQGDTGNSLAFAWNRAKKTKNYQGTIYYYFQLDRSSGNFSAPLIDELSNNVGIDTTYNISFQRISDKLLLTPGQTYQSKWRVKAVLGTYVRTSAEIFNMPLTGGTLTIGIDKYNLAKSITVYPNPTSSKIFVTSAYKILQTDLINIAGEVVYTTSKSELNADNLKEGIYFLQITTNAGTAIHKLIISR